MEKEWSLFGVRFAAGGRAEIRAAAEALITAGRAGRERQKALPAMPPAKEKGVAAIPAAKEGLLCAEPPASGGACVAKDGKSDKKAAEGRAGDTRENGFYIVTPNAEITEYARRDPAFAALLDGAAMRVPDGVGVTLAARLFGRRLTRYPGIELAEELFAAAPPEGWRLFLLGGRPGVADRAGAALAARYPRIRVVGRRHGYFSPLDEAGVTEEIRTAAPDLLLVCLGSPRQEVFMATHPFPFPAMGLGGALDVWAGDVRRAPRPLRRLGLEWLWRILSEPRRARRALALPRFLLAAIGARLSLFAQNATKKRRGGNKKRQM